MKKDVYDLTSPQQNIWELEQINGSGTPINHIMSILKLEGNLDETLLIKTMNKIIESNDSFRLKFLKNGSKLCQYVEDYKFTPIDVRHVDTEDISAFVDEYQKLPLSIDKLFSICLVFTPNYSYVLYKAHHLIVDGWGFSQIADQIKDFYKKLSFNEPSEAFEKPSYLSFINRENNYIGTTKYQSDKKFWENYVKNISTAKLFKKDDLYKKDGKRFQQIFDSHLFSLIQDYCKRNKLTEYTFFLAIFSIYFCKVYNLKSITFGTSFLNRQKRFKELECSGMFVSTLPLAIEVKNSDSFLSLCQTISSTNLSLYKHCAFPYHDIQELYCSETGKNINLYEVGFSYQINKQENSIGNADMGDCTWLFSGFQNNPLSIHITTLNNEKVLNYDYWTDCFSEYDIKKMNSIIFHLISQLLDNKLMISDINLIESEDIKLLEKFNCTGNIQNSNDTVVSIFQNIVEKYPENIAICIDNINLNYKDFNKKINCIAKELLNVGVSKNSPVALFFDKSIDMIAAMFAVLKAGGCYVPILPDEASSRIEYILKDCNPKCILTHKNYDANIPIKSTIINLDKINLDGLYDIDTSSISPEDTAYIIYTSGSTGNPKGTMVMHKNIVSFKKSIENDLRLKATSKDVSMSLLKYSFDASGIDIYTSLLFGGKLVLVKKDDELNPEKIIKIMEKEKVTRSFLIPKWLEHLCIQDKLMNGNLSCLKVLGSGGEVLKPYVIEHLLSKYSNLKIYNLYGPTETTMFTTCKKIGNSEIRNNYTSIGSPMYGSRLLVVNSNLEVLPINQVGELVVYEDENSVQNIAKGYLNLPSISNEKFVTINYLGKNLKAYRTGDMAKINKNLEIEFIGRTDDVVKVNGGYLVSLNEVENKIQNLLGNSFEVFPVAVPYKNSKVIFLFLTNKEINVNLFHIRNYINSHISFYMKPHKIIELKDFPRNSSGKINRKELEKMAQKYLEENTNKLVSPKTDIEIDIYNYVKNLIHIDDFSVTDDFIDDLGVDSLSLTAIFSYLEKYNILIQDIYNNCNVKDLAHFIESQATSKIKPDLANISDVHILNNVQKFDLSTILITGSTGFLGVHLLRDLLLSKDVKKIYCVIRNCVNMTGKQRLLNMIEFYFNSDKTLLDLIKEKAIVLDGDTAKEKFGLNEKTYSELIKNVTCVINCAANVKHFIKFEQIYKDNVQSVLNLINFCQNKISLAHISTLSIAGFKSDDTENKIFDENTLFIHQDFNNNPYLVTKFEAERKILEATSQGLNAVIFRLGNIMPRISDGVFQRNADKNSFINSLKAIISCKVIAKDLLSLNVEFTPVDICTNVILELLRKGDCNSIYHILSDKMINVLELKTLFNHLNCDILDVDFKTFLDILNLKADEYVKEYILNHNLNEYSQNITLNKMKDLHLEWPSVNIDYVNKILNIIKRI